MWFMLTYLEAIVVWMDTWFVWSTLGCVALAQFCALDLCDMDRHGLDVLVAP